MNLDYRRARRVDNLWSIRGCSSSSSSSCCVCVRFCFALQCIRWAAGLSIFKCVSVNETAAAALSAGGPASGVIKTVFKTKSFHKLKYNNCKTINSAQRASISNVNLNLFFNHRKKTIPNFVINSWSREDPTEYPNWVAKLNHEDRC